MKKLDMIMKDIDAKAKARIFSKNRDRIPKALRVKKLFLMNKLRRIKKRISKNSNGRKVQELLIDKDDKEELLKKLKGKIQWLKRARMRMKLKKLMKKEGVWKLIKRHMGQFFFKKLSAFDENKVTQALEIHLASLSSEYGHFGPRDTPNIIERCHHIPIDEEEIRIKAYRALKAKSCVHDDGISSRLLSIMMLYHGRKIIKFVLNCLRKGYTPQSVKRSKTILIPKAYGDKMRCISIMHPMYRLFDFILCQWLKKAADLFINCQFGFMEGKGAVDLFIKLQRIIEKIKDKNPALVLSLDLADAFDKVNFNFIRIALRYAKVSPELGETIIQHIQHRSSYLIKDNEKKWKHHEMGTPQGSFLGPLIFSLIAKCIEFVENEYINLLIYADDIYVICEGDGNDSKYWGEAEKRIDAIIRTMQLGNLMVNQNKVKCMVLKFGDKDFHGWADGNRRIKVAGMDHQLRHEMNVLGINLRATKNQGKWRISVSNQMFTAVVQKQKLFRSFAASLQSLKPDWFCMLINSIMIGVCLYYGQIQRLFSSWKSFQAQCEAVMKIIGATIISCYDLKRSLSNKLAYFLCCKKPLSVRIEETLSNYCLRISPCNERRWIPEDIWSPKIYGIKVFSNGFDWDRLHATRPETWWQEVAQPMIRYWRSRIGYDQWFKIIIRIHPFDDYPSFFNFWAPNESYLENLAYAIEICLRPFTSWLRGKSISIECDRALARRLSKPKKWNGLNIFMLRNGCKWIFTRRERQRFRVTYDMMDCVPRVVVHPNINYFQYLETVAHLEDSRKVENIAEKYLHLYKFQPINWEVIRRSDFLAICELAGAWRNKDMINTLRCNVCERLFRTAEIFLHPCDHLPKFNFSNLTPDERALRFQFSSLDKIVNMGRHLRMKV